MAYDENCCWVHAGYKPRGRNHPAAPYVQQKDSDWNPMWDDMMDDPGPLFRLLKPWPCETCGTPAHHALAVGHRKAEARCEAHKEIP